MMSKDLDYFSCLGCRGGLLMQPFQREPENSSRVKEGVLFCDTCKIYYPIFEGIAYLFDRCYYEGFDVQSFLNKWESKFDFQAYHFLNRTICPEKLNQMSFYNKDSNSYDELVTTCNFWKAIDDTVLAEWISDIRDDGPVLDLGCGTGRCSIPLAKQGKYVMATDISVGMIRKAIEKSKAAGLNNVTFFLADAENLPLKPASFAAVISPGVLHHLAHPASAIKEISTLLRERGSFYTHENHDSPLRPVFDFLMRMKKLWNEEAGVSPLFRIEDLEDLLRDNGLNPEIRTSTFLPPHFFNSIDYSFARKILILTDFLCGRTPVLRNFGGLVLVKAYKK
jgi:ubiquinone/menaquinone biosynthesis C-methylase UbiE/uncharacterized protein YbaR (Trm112 family)